MGKHCCVLGCKTAVSLPFHIFPKDQTMMDKWKEAVFSKKIEGLTDEELRKYAVCYKHFAESDYIQIYTSRRLKPGVIPSLNIPSKDSDISKEENKKLAKKKEKDSNDKTTKINGALKDSTTEMTDTVKTFEEIELIEITEHEEPTVKISQNFSISVNKNPPKLELKTFKIPESKSLTEVSKPETVRSKSPVSQPVKSQSLMQLIESHPLEPKSLELEPSLPESSQLNALPPELSSPDSVQSMSLETELEEVNSVSLEDIESSRSKSPKLELIGSESSEAELELESPTVLEDKSPRPKRRKSEHVKLKSSEPKLKLTKSSESNSTESLMPESSKFNSITSLLDLQTLVQGKYFHEFTPQIWKLYKLSSMLKQKQEIMSKKKLSFCQRIRQAKKYSKSTALEKLLSSLTSVQRKFLEMQIKTSKYAPKDRQFTLNEKITALSIMQSSKCYQYLTQIFNLPSIGTLRCILQKVQIHPGPIKFINQHLNTHVKRMSQRDKACCLMWDEMFLQPHLDYDAKKGHILGFQDFGQKRSPQFVDHALVFMVRGIHSGWKFPLAYYFCDGATKPDQLIEWIKNIVTIIVESGLYLMAFVCDDRRTNLTVINKLKLESSRLKFGQGQLYYGYITLNNHDIIPLFDPPYLIKGVRDKLLNNDLEFDCIEGEERKFASWEIIEQAYHMDLTDSKYRLMPKITAEHVIKSKIKKKKVKYAAEVLSTTMGGFIDHHTKLEGCVNTVYGPLKMPDKKGRDTAEMVLFFDRLFDSLNGHTLKPEKPLRVAISQNNIPHFPFWERAVKRLQRMRFVDPKTKNPITDSTVLKNWIITIRGFRKLWKILKLYDTKFFKPRILNLDCLRHFLGQIRSCNTRHPTCAEFESSFKILLINNLSSPRVENSCENKIDGSLLFSLKDFIRETESKCDNSLNDLLLDLEIETKGEKHDHLITCNCIATKILNNSRIKGCETCKNLLTNNAKNCGLVSSENLLRAFEDAHNILKEKISSVCHKHHIAIILETELYTLLDLSWLNCEKHYIPLKELLVSYIVVFYIYEWCNTISDILTGEEQNNTS